MKIKIYWNNDDSKILLEKVNITLDELWLTDFIEISSTFDEEIKTKLNITKQPALIVEEESIDFIDTIFEWIIPNDEELKSMFISIIWWNSQIWCSEESCFNCFWC